jgi:hypothetical protein
MHAPIIPAQESVDKVAITVPRRQGHREVNLPAETAKPAEARRKPTPHPADSSTSLMCSCVAAAFGRGGELASASPVVSVGGFDPPATTARDGDGDLIDSLATGNPGVGGGVPQTPPPRCPRSTGMTSIHPRSMLPRHPPHRGGAWLVAGPHRPHPVLHARNGQTSPTRFPEEAECIRCCRPTALRADRTRRAVPGCLATEVAATKYTKSACAD